MQLLKKYWDEKPLTFILFIAVVLRIISAVFSKGFGWHDDHFLVIEAAQSWVDGKDYNRWLPINGNTTPSGHSFFYPGFHFLLFTFLKWLGITEPQSKMFVVRFLHALFSLLIVVLGYRITEKIRDRNAARIAGLLLAAYWFMPFLSVRNLVEFVSIPFLMISSWIIIKNQPKAEDALQRRDKRGSTLKIFFISGLFLGMAMCVRFQCFIFAAGLGLALLFQSRWKQCIYLAMGTIFFFCLFQGVNDYLIWGRPFAEFTEYARYNMINAYNVLTNTWYSYFLLLLGLLLPPVSIFLLFGFFKVWRRHSILFLPSFLFLLFHIIFPNKQERFILTIVPFVIIAGVIGWTEFVSRSGFWNKRKKLLKGCYIFSIVINCILLPFTSTVYSKQARVESMVYLSKDPNIQLLAFEDTNHDGLKMALRFYLKRWLPILEVSSIHPWDEVLNGVTTMPDYILFMEDTNLENRVAAAKKYFPTLHYVKTIEQGIIDDLLHKMNPNNNVNQVIYIYKVK